MADTGHPPDGRSVRRQYPTDCGSGHVLAEPSRQPYGVTAECSDDQGSQFYLAEF